MPSCVKQDIIFTTETIAGMRLRCEIECKGYVGLFRPRASDSPTKFRLPAGGRGDVIIRTGTSPVGILLIPYGGVPLKMFRVDEILRPYKETN